VSASPSSRLRLYVCIVPLYVVTNVPLPSCKDPDNQYSGAFTKLRKTTISSVMSDRPSVRKEHFASHSADLHENLYLSILRKSVQKVQASLKSDDDQYTFMIISRSILLIIENVSDIICRFNPYPANVENRVS
jgi:hypothetical protein